MYSLELGNLSKFLYEKNERKTPVRTNTTKQVSKPSPSHLIGNMNMSYDTYERQSIANAVPTNVEVAGTPSQGAIEAPSQSAVERLYKFASYLDASMLASHRSTIIVDGNTKGVPTSVEAVEAPSQSVAEAPSQSVAEAPSQSVAEAPSQSVVEAPSQSVVEAPSQSVVEAPSQSVVEAPSQSAVELLYKLASCLDAFMLASHRSTILVDGKVTKGVATIFDANIMLCPDVSVDIGFRGDPTILKLESYTLDINVNTINKIVIEIIDFSEKYSKPLNCTIHHVISKSEKCDGCKLNRYSRCTHKTHEVGGPTRMELDLVLLLNDIEKLRDFADTLYGVVNAESPYIYTHGEGWREKESGKKSQSSSANSPSASESEDENE
jgi:hypothetical protein